METLTLNTGVGANFVTLTSSPSGGNVNVNTGGGNDTLKVALPLAANVFYHGGAEIGVPGDRLFLGDVLVSDPDGDGAGVITTESGRTITFVDLEPGF